MNEWVSEEILINRNASKRDFELKLTKFLYKISKFRPCNTSTAQHTMLSDSLWLKFNDAHKTCSRKSLITLLPLFCHPSIDNQILLLDTAKSNENQENLTSSISFGVVGGDGR